MTSPGFWAVRGALVATALVAASGLASANTMSFTGTGIGIGNCCTPPPYVEDGIIATPTAAPGTSLPSSAHFDISDLAIYGGTPGSNSVGVIHRGNGGEQVTFTFAGGNFDLGSVAITGWDQDFDPTTLTGVFASSSGATLNVSGPTLQSIDFSALSGWANITFFSFTVPVGVGTCASGGVTPCAGVGFDNVVMNSPSAVPLPAALPLFVSALAGLGLLGRRRRAATFEVV